MNIVFFSYQGYYDSFRNDVLSVIEIINSYFKNKISFDFYTDQRKFVNSSTQLITENFFQKTIRTYKGLFADQIKAKMSKINLQTRARLLKCLPYDLVIQPVIMYHEMTSSLKGIQVPDVRLYLCRETRMRPVSLKRDTFYPERDFEVIADETIYPTAYMKNVLHLFLETAEKRHAETVDMILPVTLKSSFDKKWASLFETMTQEMKMPSRILTVQDFWESFIETPKKFRWIFAPDPLCDVLFYSLNVLLNKSLFSCSVLLTQENKFYLENVSEFYKGLPNYRSPLTSYHALAMMYDLLDMAIPARILRRGINEAISKGWLTPEMGGTMNASEVSNLYASFIDRELSEMNRY